LRPAFRQSGQIGIVQRGNHAFGAEPGAGGEERFERVDLDLRRDLDELDVEHPNSSRCADELQGIHI
jgi:hypothetical protein